MGPQHLDVSGTESAILPVLLFLVFFGKRQGKPPKNQGSFVLAEPLKSLEKKGKALKKTRKSSPDKKKQGIPKKTRKGRTGFRIVRFESCDFKVALSIGRLRFGWRF